MADITLKLLKATGGSALERSKDRQTRTKTSLYRLRRRKYWQLRKYPHRSKVAQRPAQIVQFKLPYA